MLASSVTVPEVGVQISGNGSVVRRLWGEGGKSKARRAEFNQILKQWSANIFCKGPDRLCRSYGFCCNSSTPLLWHERGHR